MTKQWFVLHTLTGQEGKAFKSIDARIKLEHVEEYIGRCVIPTEKVVEKKNGKKRTITRRVFPGYLLCELALYDNSRGLDENGKRAIYERTWEFLRATPGVIGFIGGDRPMPLKQSEVDAILSDKPQGQEQVERPKQEFNVDETVKITDGAFMGLTGTVSMVDPDKGKLKVEVKVFGRMVPVDVEYWQLEKVSAEELPQAAK